MKISNHLTRILNDIDQRAQFRCKLPYLQDLEFTLQHLEASEKALLASKIYEMDYCEGSGALLKSFDRLGIIAIENFVVSIEDPEILLNILDDFMESQPALFAKLVESSLELNYSQSAKLTTILDNYITDYIYDLYGNPACDTLNYFDCLWPELSDDALTKVQERIVITLLEMEPMSLTSAIGQQHKWRSEDQKTPMTTLKSVLKNTLQSLELATMVLEFVQTSITSTNWQFYLTFIRILGQNLGSKLLSKVKEYLQQCFQAAIKNQDEKQLHLMLLTARELAYTLPAFGDYYSWYKPTIGEMRYTVSKEEFRYVLKALSRLVEFERSEDVLQVHLKTSIPAPIHCSELVITYKAVIRSKLENLQGHENDVIMVE